MPLYWLTLIVLALATLGYVMGRNRALTSVGGNQRLLHSLPSYYGWNVFLTVMTPALGLMVLWLLLQPYYVENRVSDLIPTNAYSESGGLNLIMSDVRRVSDGLNILVETGRVSEDEAQTMLSEGTEIRDQLAEVGVALGSNVEPAVLKAAQAYRALSNMGNWLMWGAVLLVGLGGFAVAYMMTQQGFSRSEHR